MEFDSLPNCFQGRLWISTAFRVEFAQSSCSDRLTTLHLFTSTATGYASTEWNSQGGHTRGARSMLQRTIGSQQWSCMSERSLEIKVQPRSLPRQHQTTECNDAMPGHVDVQLQRLREEQEKADEIHIERQQHLNEQKVRFGREEQSQTEREQHLGQERKSQSERQQRLNEQEVRLDHERKSQTEREQRLNDQGVRLDQEKQSQTEREQRLDQEKKSQTERERAASDRAGGASWLGEKVADRDRAAPESGEAVAIRKRAAPQRAGGAPQRAGSQPRSQEEVADREEEPQDGGA
jgi:hypothetical protein